MWYAKVFEESTCALPGVRQARCDDTAVMPCTYCTVARWRCAARCGLCGLCPVVKLNAGAHGMAVRSGRALERNGIFRAGTRKYFITKPRSFPNFNTSAEDFAVFSAGRPSAGLHLQRTMLNAMHTRARDTSGARHHAAICDSENRTAPPGS